MENRVKQDINIDHFFSSHMSVLNAGHSPAIDLDLPTGPFHGQGTCKTQVQDWILP